MVWHKDWSARRVHGKAELLNEFGAVKAREGDLLRFDALKADPLHPCGDVSVEMTPRP